MIGGVTRQMLPHLSGVPHLHVNRPLERKLGSTSGKYTTTIKIFEMVFTLILTYGSEV